MACSVLGTATSCDDDSGTGGGESISLSASPLSIANDGTECAQFEVKGADGTVLTDRAVIYNLTRSAELNEPRFSSVEAGVYRFHALCDGLVSNEVEITVTPAGSTVSEVVLTADDNKTQIVADDKDEVVFRVMADGVDVTDKGVSVCWESEGGGMCISPKDGKIVFTTATPGNYVFTAKYKNVESDPVTIRAVSGQAVETAGYVKNLLIHKFSATDCTYCPSMTSVLDKVQESLPDDKLIVMTVHCTLNEGISQFVTPESTELYELYGVEGFPTAWIDGYLDAIANALEIKTVIKRSKQVNPAVAGVDFTSAMKGSTVEVTGKLTFSADGNYKVCCALQEDGIVYKNEYSYGGEGDDHSLYNHVLRDYAQETPVTGLDLGAVSAGDTKEFTYTIAFSSDWKQENCTVVVYVLRANESGDYNVTNANSAKIGGQAVSVPLAE